MRHASRGGFASVLLGISLSVAAFAAPSQVSLEEAYKAAVAKSELVQQSAEQLNQADARESQIKGGIYPNLSFNAGHTIQALPANPVAAQFSPQHQTVVNVSLSQPLFRGLREWNGLKQLGHMRSALVAGQEQLFNRLYQEVATAYLQILSFEQDLRHLKDQMSIYEGRVKELGTRVRRGESNETDVVTAESTAASLLAETQVLEGQLDAARETFHFLTALPKAAELSDPDLTKAATVKPAETYLARLEERPDVKAAVQRLEAARKGVTVAHGAHWPTADLTGNYYLTRPGFLSDIKWDVGVKLTIPIFEGFATQAGIEEAVSKRKEAELEAERTRRAARQEISTLHRRLGARMGQLKSLVRSAELSRRNASLLQKDYRRGLTRNIDVQLALTESRIAQRTLDQAHFTSQLELIQLQSAAALTPGQAKGDSK